MTRIAATNTATTSNLLPGLDIRAETSTSSSPPLSSGLGGLYSGTSVAEQSRGRRAPTGLLPHTHTTIARILMNVNTMGKPRRSASIQALIGSDMLWNGLEDHRSLERHAVLGWRTA